MNEAHGAEQFFDRYPPDTDVARPDEVFLDYARAKAPSRLVEVWDKHGLGFYGDQRLALVDPADWLPALQEWLGPDVRSFPFAVTSFGHVYHTDASGTVQCLDPHFQTNEVVAESIDQFFGEHLLSAGSHLSDLEGPRGGGRDRFGELGPGETYYFDPPLALGGQVRPDSLAKGAGVEHLISIHRSMVSAGH